MDKRALAILNQVYWGTGGWKSDNESLVSETDFAYAKSAGVMFDPVSRQPLLSHPNLPESEGITSI